MSGQSTLSEDENDVQNGGSASKINAQASSEDSTLTLNDGVISRQSSNRDKESKYSKSRNPQMQSLNPTQLQPPSSILKAEILDESENNSAKMNKHSENRSSFESKRFLQRTFHVDINDPEQPLLYGQEQGLRNKDLDTIHSISPPLTPQGKEWTITNKVGSGVPSGGSPTGGTSTPLPTGVMPAGLRSRSPQVNSGWL